MFPYLHIQDQSINAKLIIAIEKMACAGCGNDATGGSGGVTTDAGMRQLLITAIQRLSCYNCGG